MDTQERLQNWRQRLSKLWLGVNIPPELRVLLGQSIYAVQSASRLFSDTQSVLPRGQQDVPSHQKAFQDLMCVEAQRSALWNLMNNVMDLWQATMANTADDWSPGTALNTIWEVRLEISDKFDKMSEDFDTWVQRKAFNEAIRPLARPLSILDIPMELWNQIFEQFLAEEDDDNLWLFADSVSGGCNIESIKNVRLTCRRFCDASSHLLFRRVNVTLHHDSLAQLDKISRHSIFSKGVRALRVDLSCYPYHGHLAENESSFVTATIDEVCNWIFFHRETHQISDEGRDIFRSQSLPRAQIAEALDRADRAVAVWQHYLRSGCQMPLLDEEDVEASAENIAAITALHGCYQKYQTRFMDQNHRQERGRFMAHFVAQAVARMPNAVRLFMTDSMNYVSSCEFHDSAVGTRMVELVSDLNLLIRERMLKPSTTWAEVEDHPDVAPPSHMLHLLPVALHHARVPLLHFGINVSWNPRARWKLADQDVSSLRGLARTLSLADYHGPSEFPHIQASSMHKYLSALLSGEKLEKISIDFRLERTETMEIGPVLASLSPVSSIRSVTLRHCSLHLDQLGSYLRNPTDKSLTLHGIRLLSGTWADVLELLRETVTEEASVVSVQRPTGAECDDMSREVYNAIFASGPNPDYKNSKANQYIAKWSYGNMRNPLRPELVEENQASSTTNNAQDAV